MKITKLFIGVCAAVTLPLAHFATDKSMEDNSPDLYDFSLLDLSNEQRSAVAANVSADHDGAVFTYIVKSGDTLSEISEALDIPIRSILESNPTIDNVNSVQAGQTLICLVPKGFSYQDPANEPVLIRPPGL